MQFIRSEGVELFDKPKPPEMNEVTGKRPADILKQEAVPKRNFSTDKEWLDYCEWLSRLSIEAVHHFSRGVQIGVGLHESYIVCQGSAYAWNYLHHIFDERKYNQVTSILSELFEALKTVGHGK